MRVHLTLRPGPDALRCRWEETAVRELRHGLEQMVEEVREAVAAHTPVGATGELSRSVEAFIVGRGVELTGVVASPLPYASFVEEGRGPGAPPPWQPIALWVRGTTAGREIVVQVQERYLRNLKGGVSRRSLQSFERQATHLVRMKIARRGTAGAHMFAEGLRDAAPRMEQLWAEVGRQIANQWQRGEGVELR